MRRFVMLVLLVSCAVAQKVRPQESYSWPKGAKAEIKIDVSRFQRVSGARSENGWVSIMSVQNVSRHATPAMTFTVTAVDDRGTRAGHAKMHVPALAAGQIATVPVSFSSLEIPAAVEFAAESQPRETSQ